MMLSVLLALAMMQGNSPKPFFEYMKRPEPSFSYEAKAAGTGLQIDFTSQTWQGIPWKHTILMSQPKDVKKDGMAILYITGDGPRPADHAELAMITAATGLTVATLFDVPNQPLFGELKEDDLIAHTFERYLATDDATWPLLFPMAKSAVKAMDAIQAATKGSDNPITKFLVTGASKRGWTTWFVGAANDPRVLGIAPMVIDNLNVAKQMPHQMTTWGKYSEQIEEYTRRGLQAQLETPKGKVLAQMIDPYYYLDQIQVPTLIVTGANDPYWTVDAMSLYWDDLKMPHWASISPNAGHDLGNKIQTVQAVGAFARSLAGEFEMPELSFTLTPEAVSGSRRELTLSADSQKQPFRTVNVWTATADDLDFRPVKWEKVATMTLSGEPREKSSKSAMRLAIPADKNVAVLAEAQYMVGSRGFTLSRPVTVFRKAVATGKQ